MISVRIKNDNLNPKSANIIVNDIDSATKLMASIDRVTGDKQEYQIDTFRAEYTFTAYAPLNFSCNGQREYYKPIINVILEQLKNNEELYKCFHYDNGELDDYEIIYKYVGGEWLVC